MFDRQLGVLFTEVFRVDGWSLWGLLSCDGYVAHLDQTRAELRQGPDPNQGTRDPLRFEIPLTLWDLLLISASVEVGIHDAHDVRVALDLCQLPCTQVLCMVAFWRVLQCGEGPDNFSWSLPCLNLLCHIRSPGCKNCSSVTFCLLSGVVRRQPIWAQLWSYRSRISLPFSPTKPAERWARESSMVPVDQSSLCPPQMCLVG